VTQLHHNSAPGRGRSDNRNISPLSAPRATDGCRDPGDVPPLRPVQQRVATGVAVPAGAGRVQVATSPADAARGTGHRPRTRRRGRVRRHVRGRFRGCQQGSIRTQTRLLGWFIAQDFKIITQRSGVCRTSSTTSLTRPRTQSSTSCTR
jgi:hypothetical protein